MNPRHVVAIALFVVVCVGLICTAPPESHGQNKANAAGQDRPKWEYKVLGGEGNKDVFNGLGEEGWELVAVAGEIRSTASGNSTPPAFYFKRKK